jgi:hypothetical protein
MCRRFFAFAALFALLCLAPTVMSAQDGPLPDGGGDPPCDGPFGPVCPIDGGLSFLAAAGIALGGKKAYDLYQTQE